MRSFAVATLLLAAVVCINAQCIPSVTTVTGTHAPKGKICKDQLILNEDFDKFDLDFWKHELSLWGGGVRIFF